jgi:hypothetical protein
LHTTRGRVRAEEALAKDEPPQVQEVAKEDAVGAQEAVMARAKQRAARVLVDTVAPWKMMLV